MLRRFLQVLACVVFFCQSSAFGDDLGQDIAGSKDHALLSRYPGSVIIGYSVSDFNVYKVATGPMKNNAVPSLSVEGKITTLTYVFPKETSTIQVLRNYEQAFKKGGFKPLLACETLQDCGGDFMRPLFQNQGPGAESRYATFGMGRDADDYRFWTGVLERDGGKVYAAVFIKKAGDNPGHILCEWVEPKPMELGLIQLNAAIIDNALTREGKVVLEGIFFDHDKAVIKTESAATLKIIADYLQSHNTVKAFVVGHTDTSGDYMHNLTLSRQRAEAVVDALVKNFKIPQSRLQAVGVGPVSPKTQNVSEEGRAKNRRVELVLR